MSEPETPHPLPRKLDKQTRNFYRTALSVLHDANVPFLLGGAYALQRYTGIERHTKDLDVFLRRADFERATAAFAAAGFHTQLTFPHWLGKAFIGELMIDLIFGSGNGIAVVDDHWFEHAVTEKVWGVRVKLIPPEEMIWSKSFIQERERFDGADVIHIVHACADRMDWARLMQRFGAHWRVLFSHLILFGFVYPAERNRVPKWLMSHLQDRLTLELERPDDDDKLCEGPLLSRAQYLVDIDEWGYEDARITPRGNMSTDDVALWTAAIDKG